MNLLIYTAENSAYIIENVQEVHIQDQSGLRINQDEDRSGWTIQEAEEK